MIGQVPGAFVKHKRTWFLSFLPGRCFGIHVKDTAAVCTTGTNIRIGISLVFTQSCFKSRVIPFSNGFLRNREVRI